MYVLIKADVDHENETLVWLVGSSDELSEVQEMMEREWREEMKEPSPKFVDEWDSEYSTVGALHAQCEIETCDWSIHWHIFNTDDPGWFSFI